MNRNELTEALNSFLDDDVLQVAALSGDWGVGKTYFWRNFSESLQLGDAFNGQSYSSMFGANSLVEIRGRISAGMLLSKDRKNIMQRYSDEMGKLLVPRQLSGKTIGLLEMIDRFRRGDLAGFASEASYWFVRDALVCLDDLERLPKGFDSRTLLGIVDELRERGCKVVLLLNRDRLPADDETLQQYWEKVVDIDLSLIPEVDSNVAIVFEGADLPPEFLEAATRVFRSVDCRNIRIHRRAVGLIKAIMPDLEGITLPVQLATVEHAALLCWALLDPSQALSEDVVGSEKYGSMWVAILSHGDARARLTPEEEEWAKVIERTAFSPLPFDHHLMSYIKTGWLDHEAICETLRTVDASAEALQCERQLNGVLRAYRDDFTLDRDAYVERMVEVLRAGLAHLTVFDFDTGIEVLERRHAEIDDLVNDYIVARDEHLQAVAEAQGRDREPKNTTLREEVARRKAEYLARRFTIDGVANDLAAQDGWSRSQIEYLAGQPVDAYLEWMRSNPPNLGRKIRAIQDVVGGDDETDTQARTVLEQALLTLAGENDFNAERIRRVYGVAIPADEGNNPNEAPEE